MLLISTVDTEKRLRQFLLTLGVLIVTLASIALLQFHEVIDLPSLSALARFDTTSAGETIRVVQLRGTGIFNDPNDLSMILVTGMLISGFFIMDSGLAKRLVWIAAICVVFYAFALTKSRGGLLALGAGSIALGYLNFGWKKTLAACIVVLPVALSLLEGRMTDMDVSEGTGQHRIQIWAESIAIFRMYPIFGIGKGFLVEETLYVTHNSFIQAYAEIGFIGGTCFLGAFASAVVSCWQVQTSRVASTLPRQLLRLSPFMVAIVIGAAASMMSISRNYVPPTYLILGLATCFVWVAQQRSEVQSLRFESGFLVRLVPMSILFIAASYIFVRLGARW